MNKQEPFKDFVRRCFPDADLSTAEIKRFSLQIQKALRLIAECGDYDFNNEELRRKLIVLGFTQHYSSGYAFVGDTQVIKNMYEYNPRTGYPPKHFRVPMVILRKGSDNYKLVVQPRVNTNIDDYDKIYKALEEALGASFDIHGGNFGYYKDRPVLFDW
jgi:hypothetical protein